MSPFLETLFGGLALASITALTFVAYKHPKTYARVYNVMSMGLMAIGILWAVFVIGNVVGQYEAHEATRRLNDDFVVTGNIKGPVGWQFLVWPVCSAYLILLSFFPAIFKDELEPNNDTPKKKAEKEGF